MTVPHESIASLSDLPNDGIGKTIDAPFPQSCSSVLYTLFTDIIFAQIRAMLSRVHIIEFDNCEQRVYQIEVS